MTASTSPLIDALIAAGHQQLAARIEALRPTDPVQAMIVRAMADALDRAGPEGLAKLGSELLALLDGEAPVDIDLGDLRSASDTLAALQQLEGERRSSARDLVVRITATVTPLASAILRSVL